MKEMKNAAAELFRCLYNNKAFTDLLGGRTSKYKRVYNSQYCPHSEELPRVTVIEILNDDAEFADDEPDASDVIIRADIWSLKDNCFTIARELKKIVKSTFQRSIVTLESEIYEKDTKIYHKPVKIRLIVEQEDYND